MSRRTARRQGRRQVRRLALATALAGLLVPMAAACGSGTAGDPVTRSGRSFQVDGKPFRFVGVNLYDAAASDVYSCEPAARLTDRQLRSALRTAHDDAGATVVRFWAYQTYTAGGTDFSGVDRVLSAARAAGMRALPVLEDGPGDCTTGPRGTSKEEVDGDSWYTTGYRRPYGNAALSYRDYARVVAEHYRGDPTVLGWMLMNEAETRTRDEQDRSALVDFAQDVAGVVKTADPGHLVTLGTQANGAFGTSGRDFTDIYRLPALDFSEAHDWAFYGSDTEALPGSAGGGLPVADSPDCTALDAKIACSFARAAALGKPRGVGEAGIRATDPAGRARRAQLFRSKLDAAFAGGASGYLVWQLNRMNTDGYAVAPTPSDPLLRVLAAAGKRVS